MRNRLWFSRECDIKRRHFNRARSKYAINKSLANKRNLETASKAYKKTMKKNYRSYIYKMENEIRNTSKTESKKFWKILKDIVMVKLTIRLIYLSMIYITTLKNLIHMTMVTMM